MSKARANRVCGWARPGLAGTIALVTLLSATSSSPRAADEARRIMEEAQKRSTSKSERYEGLLQSFDPKGKNSEKRWTLERLGSYGHSKSVIRFTWPIWNCQKA